MPGLAQGAAPPPFMTQVNFTFADESHYRQDIPY
jgi:hypothetical protein